MSCDPISEGETNHTQDYPGNEKHNFKNPDQFLLKTFFKKKMSGIFKRFFHFNIIL
jgi:hypothetical protein